MDAQPFACTVTESGIVFADAARAMFKTYAQTLEGQACLLTLEAEPIKASDRQRRWWFGQFIPIVSEEAGYDREERHGLHIELLRMCFGTYEKDGIELAHRPSWTGLSVREAWHLMEWGVRFAAKTWGVSIRFPSEMEADVQALIASQEAEPRQEVA